MHCLVKKVNILTNHTNEKTTLLRKKNDKRDLYVYSDNYESSVFFQVAETSVGDLEI